MQCIHILSSQKTRECSTYEKKIFFEKEIRNASDIFRQNKNGVSIQNEHTFLFLTLIKLKVSQQNVEQICTVPFTKSYGSAANTQSNP